MSSKKKKSEPLKQSKEERRRQWKERQEQRWQQWIKGFESEILAQAHAIKISNSWGKRLGKLSQDFDFELNQNILIREFPNGMERVWVEAGYTVKSAWISANEQYLVSGKKVRFEGKGKNGRWLYEHKFSIEGQEFLFHSYDLPKEISTELGENFPPFSGKALSEQEIKEIQQKLEIKNYGEFVEMLCWNLCQKKLW